jgi:hypothetical protein
LDSQSTLNTPTAGLIRPKNSTAATATEVAIVELKIV